MVFWDVKHTPVPHSSRTWNNCSIPLYVSLSLASKMLMATSCYVCAFSSHAIEITSLKDITFLVQVSPVWSTLWPSIRTKGTPHPWKHLRWKQDPSANAKISTSIFLSLSPKGKTHNSLILQINFQVIKFAYYLQRSVMFSIQIWLKLVGQSWDYYFLIFPLYNCIPNINNRDTSTLGWIKEDDARMISPP